MKRLLSAAAALLCAAGLAASAPAQTTTVTATALKIPTPSGPVAVTGTIALTPVNQFGQPIGVVTSDFQQFQPGAFTAVVTAGAIANSFAVPDQATATALTPNTPIAYQVTVYNTATRTSSTYTIPSSNPVVTGSTFALDHYIPAQSAQVSAVSIITQANPPSHCQGAQIYYSTANPSTVKVCVGGIFVVTSGGGGSSIALLTNGTSNTSQSRLNIVAGTGLSASSDGSGNVTLAATGGSGNSSGAPTETSRIVYSRPFFDSSWTSDFTTTGTVATVNGTGGLVLTASNGTNFDASAVTLAPGGTTYYTLLDHIDIRANFLFTTSGNGIYVGRDSLSGQSFTVQWNPSTQQLVAWQQASGTQSGVNAWQPVNISLNPSAGDAMQLLVQQRGATIQAVLTDATTGAKATGVWVSPMAPNSGNTFNMPASSAVRVGVLGGSYALTQLEVVDKNPQYPVLAVVGDSKVAGYAALSDKLRFSALLPFGPVSTFGGPGDGTTPIYSAVADVIAAHPQKVLLSVGSNDVRNGASLSSTESTYGVIVTQLKNAGIAVAHIATIPENTSGGGVDQSALRSWIIATYGSGGANDTIIDPQTQGWSVSSDIASDGIHPNVKGHALLASLVAAAHLSASTTKYESAEYGFGTSQPSVVSVPGYRLATAMGSAGTISAGVDLVYATGTETLTLPNVGGLTAATGPQPTVTVVSFGGSTVTLQAPTNGQIFANGGNASTFVIPPGMQAVFTSYGEAGGGGTAWNLVSFGMGGVTGSTCSGTPSSSFASVSGIVTHC